MFSPVTNKSLRRLWRFRWGYKPLFMNGSDYNNDAVIQELSQSGHIRVDKCGTYGEPEAGARYVITISGRVFWDNWSRDRFTRVLAILAILISVAALSVSLLK